MADNLFQRIGRALGGDDRIEKVAPTQTIGSSVTSVADITTGQALEAADRKHNLNGPVRFDKFDEMVRDISIVAASVRLFLNLCSNAVWTINPPEGLNGNEEPVAQEYADFLYDQIFGMTTAWSTVVRKAAVFRLVGFAILEWTAKRTEDGRIGLLDIEHRPQRTIARWLRDASGTVVSVIQQVSGRSQVTIPRAKIVYAVDDVLTDSPEGVGLYRHLYAVAERLDTFETLEEIGFTTDLRGIPVGRAPLDELAAEVKAAGPAGSDAFKAADAKRKLKLQPIWDFVNKHMRNRKMGAILPSDTFSGRQPDGSVTPSSVPKWALELLNGDSQSFEAMAEAIKRLNQEMARILGTEHLLLGADGGGSLALARSKVGTFYLTVTSSLQDLVEVFDRDIIAPIAELNGWPEELWPQFGVNEISDRDLDQVASVLLKLAQAGATIMPNDPAVGEMRDALGLSRPDDDTLALQLDASLNPRRTDPQNPDDDMEGNPEKVAKVRVIKSRRARLRRRAK